MVGFSSTFNWTSLAIFISAILVIFTKEFQINEVKKSEKQNYTSKEVLKHILTNPVLVTVLILSMLIQVAHFSIQPILSLYVSEIHGPENLALYAGIAFSAAGVGNLMMSKTWGKLGDNYGYIKILMALLFLAGIVYFPGGFVTEMWQLIIIRFALGVTIGGIIPVRIAYIRQAAPIAMQGEVLGYNTSLRFLGNVIGPVMGGMVAGAFGFTAVFITTSLLLIASGVILLVSVMKNPKYLKNSSTS